MAEIDGVAAPLETPGNHGTARAPHEAVERGGESTAGAPNGPGGSLWFARGQAGELGHPTTRGKAKPADGRNG
jgi:hypothetical protein